MVVDVRIGRGGRGQDILEEGEGKRMPVACRLVTGRQDRGGERGIAGQSFSARSPMNEGCSPPALGNFHFDSESGTAFCSAGCGREGESRF